MKFIFGTKLGMTRVFDAEGKSVAVNVIKTLTGKVARIKTVEKDGYESIVVESIDKYGDKETVRKIEEFKVENMADYTVGKTIDVSQFQPGDRIEVTGTSKGKGFAGTIKRHGFKRGPESHGGNNVREPGSIGAQQPQRVVLGRKMAGHMGMTTVTVKNLRVVDVDKDTILVSGAIPGPNKSLVRIKGN